MFEQKNSKKIVLPIHKKTSKLFCLIKTLGTQLFSIMYS